MWQYFLIPPLTHPHTPVPPPFEDRAKPSRGGPVERGWPTLPKGGAVLHVINGLARFHGRETCFLHEGFNLHVSENLLPVMVSAGC